MALDQPDLDRQTRIILSAVAERMCLDYDRERSLFADVGLPETAPIESIEDREDRLRFILFGTTLDYQRPADRHWQTMLDLFETMPECFDPESAASLSPGYLESVFRASGIRFPRNDAEAWIANAEWIASDHDGSVTQFLESCEHEADQIRAEIERADPYHLTGQKLKPFFVKLLRLHGQCVDPDEVEIPVDIQVRRVTRWLHDTVRSDDEPTTASPTVDLFDDDVVRAFWTAVAETASVDVHDLDTPLWLVGSEFEDGGRAYLESILDDLGLATIWTPNDLVLSMPVRKRYV